LLFRNPFDILKFIACRDSRCAGDIINTLFDISNVDVIMRIGWIYTYFILHT